MQNSRAPIKGLMVILVHRDCEVHVRYGSVYDSYDPDHLDNAWVNKLKLHIEKEAKKFIAEHSKEVS